MKRMTKYAAIFLALLLCLTALCGCGSKEPQDTETPGDLQPGQEQPDDQEQPSSPELLGDTIVCSDGNTTLRFERNAAGNWQWKDGPDFPLDATYVEGLAECAKQMLAAQPIVTDKTPEDLDLDSDKKYMTVTDEKGHKVTWYLGEQDEAGRYYMRFAKDETSAIYLAPAELTDQISRSIYDMMLLPQLHEMAADKIRSVTVSADGKSVTTTPNSSGVWVVGSSNVNEKAQPMVQAISRMQIGSCVDYQPTAGAVSICGFDTPRATLAVDFVSAVGAEHALSLSIGAKLQDGYCVRVGDDSTIYLMKASVIEPVLAFIQS